MHLCGMRFIHFTLQLFAGLLLLTFCTNPDRSKEDRPNTTKTSSQQDTDTIPCHIEDTLSTPPLAPSKPVCNWVNYFDSLGLVDIQSVDSTLYIDLKYTTTDNFMETDVYDCLKQCYLQPDIAERLQKCQTALKEIDSTLSLKVYDGVRPRSVQQFMWDLLDMPIQEKVQFVSNPANGSLHNFGAAVDVTIINTITQEELDMGTPYDYIGVLAWPTKEQAHLKDNLLTQDQVNNRILLRKVLKKGNFFNIQTEWWHFNACTRNKAKTLYKIIE